MSFTFFLRTLIKKNVIIPKKLINSTILEGKSDFREIVGIKKFIGSDKKIKIFSFKLKSRSALSLLQLGNIKIEEINIQKIKKVNFKSNPVFFKRIKYKGKVTKTGACEVEKIKTMKKSTQLSALFSL